MTGAVTAVQVGSSPRCRSCQAAIWFGLTLKGKRMPIDPQPVEDGNVVIDRLLQALDQIAGANESGPGQALAPTCGSSDATRSSTPTSLATSRISPRAQTPSATAARTASTTAKARAMGIEAQP